MKGSPQKLVSNEINVNGHDKDLTNLTEEKSPKWQLSTQKNINLNIKSQWDISLDQNKFTSMSGKLSNCRESVLIREINSNEVITPRNHPTPTTLTKAEKDKVVNLLNMDKSNENPVEHYKENPFESIDLNSQFESKFQ